MASDLWFSLGVSTPTPCHPYLLGMLKFQFAIHLMPDGLAVQISPERNWALSETFLEIK